MLAPIASRSEWLAARMALLEKEKAATRMRDELAAARRALPRVRIDTDYRFQTPDGDARLIDLFGSHSQLLVDHFMFGPDWEEGCTACSFWADAFDGLDVHLAARDVAFVVVSAAPLAKLDAYKQRMGWHFDWVSSEGSTFNRDMGVAFTPEELEAGTAEYNYAQNGFPVSEAPGLSVFVREGDTVFHTYSVFSRGLDGFNPAYQLLDLMPKGRDEADLPHSMAWLKRHDQYEA